MPGAHEHHSDVVRLLSQISAEYEAAQRGLSGFAAGRARHDFIAARTEHIGTCHEALVELVGAEEAIAMIAEAIWSPQDQGVAP